MVKPLSRRSFVAAGAGVSALAVLGSSRAARVRQDGENAVGVSTVHDGFPAQPPELVQQTVGASHGNFERVKELVSKHPELAKAQWDWGFGDWESALGAASHTGNRAIAEYLIEHGARPTLFSAAMLGQLAVVRAFCEAMPGVQRTPGPHGITLLAHARFGGDEAVPVVEYLESIGDADIRPTHEALDDSTRAALLGTYRFGHGPADTLIISERRGMLQLQRGEGVARTLHHQGDLLFTVSGARSVRVQGVIEGDVGRSITILDPGPVVIATRAHEG